MANFDAKARFKSIEETCLRGTKIDYDNLWRFISRAACLSRPKAQPEDMSDEIWRRHLGMWGPDPDPESIKVAGYFLLELLEAAKRGDDLNAIVNQQLGVKKIRRKIFDPAQANIHTPAFSIVMAYCRGELTKPEAIKEFREHVKPASDKQIRRWIDAIKPKAEEAARTFAMEEHGPRVTKYPPPREE